MLVGLKSGAIWRSQREGLDPDLCLVFFRTNLYKIKNLTAQLFLSPVKIFGDTAWMTI
jgi:hypothetical protein